MAFRYSDLLVDVMANNGGCPEPSKPNCPAPSKPQCPNPSKATGIAMAASEGGLALLQEQLRASV